MSQEENDDAQQPRRGKFAERNRVFPYSRWLGQENTTDIKGGMTKNKVNSNIFETMNPNAVEIVPLTFSEKANKLTFKFKFKF